MKLTQIAGGAPAGEAVVEIPVAVFQEAARALGIRWQLCEPSIMAVQIDRLMSLSQQSNIHIGVLPLSTQVRKWCVPHLCHL